MKVFNVFYALLLVSFISEAAFAQHRPGPGGPGGPGRPGPGGPGPSRPQPGPAPRPQPGPAPRPQPGPAPRPQPGPAPRPQPGPAPRPQPGPAPRPQPAPAPRPQPPMPRPQPSQQQACFYEHDNFQGHAICVNPGSVIYRLSDYGLARRFSSAIIPQGWSVTVYEYDNFGGASLTLYGQIHTLRMYGDYWNDRISSIDFRY